MNSSGSNVISVESESESSSSESVEIVRTPPELSPRRGVRNNRGVKAPLHWQSKSFFYTSYRNEHPNWDPSRMVYTVYQREKCPDTGLFHWQGFVAFRSKVRASLAIKAIGDPNIHIERPDSVPKSMAYCKKSKTRVEGPFEKGDKTKVRVQGERTDLQKIKEALDAKSDLRAISQTHFSQYLRYANAFKSYLCLNAPQRDFAPCILIIWGESGIGKSRLVRERYKDAFWVGRPTHASRPVWFDGYSKQDALVFDDFYGWLPYDYMLRLLDRYPLQLDCRGQSIPCMARHYIFTSNLDPLSWYPNVDDRSALRRRFAEFGCIYMLTGESDLAKIACKGNCVITTPINE